MFSAHLDIIYGVPRGSICEPVLLNIGLRDLLFKDYTLGFANFDDTTPGKCRSTLNEVMHNLEITAYIFFEWFSFHNLKANASKCHLFLFFLSKFSGECQRFHHTKQKLWEIVWNFIHRNFSFWYHINRICCKASQRLHALSRISKYISADKKCMLFKSFKNFKNNTLKTSHS